MRDAKFENDVFFNVIYTGRVFPTKNMECTEGANASGKQKGEWSYKGQCNNLLQVSQTSNLTTVCYTYYII